jgi:pilus assembly protein Flp/PilA
MANLGFPGPGKAQPTENKMTNPILKSVNQLHRDEAGQGLVEYALIIALVAFAAVVGMNTLATDINNAFSLIGSVINVSIP